MRPRFGIFWQVYLHGLLLLAVVGIALGVVGHALGRAPPFKEYATRYAGWLRDHPDVLQSPELAARELAQQRALVGVALTLYGAHGELIATNVEPPIARPPDSELRAGEPEPYRVGRRHWVIVAPIGDGPRPSSILLLTHGSPDPVRGILTVAAVMIGLAIGSIALARAISRPLESLTGTAQRLGSGDLSVRTGIRRRDEVGRLASALDEMADRIEQLLRSERELLANVSHELRTPLARIRVALEIANEGDAERARSYLGEIATDLAEVERLIEDVFTAARLDLAAGPGGGAPPLRREAVPASEIVANAVERFRSAHPDRLLEVESAGGLPVLDADPTLLRRVIDNLLDNARKYSEPNQPIGLAARAEEGTLVVEVRDRGIGIPAEDRARLFTPFYRSDPSRVRDTGGVGLGLTLARRIVEAHGGHIGVESTAGQGTTVTFRIPPPGVRSPGGAGAAEDATGRR